MGYQEDCVAFPSDVRLRSVGHLGADHHQADQTVACRARAWMDAAAMGGRTLAAGAADRILAAAGLALASLAVADCTPLADVEAARDGTFGREAHCDHAMEVDGALVAVGEVACHVVHRVPCRARTARPGRRVDEEEVAEDLDDRASWDGME